MQQNGSAFWGVSVNAIVSSFFDEEYPAKNKIHLTSFFVFQVLLYVEVRGKFQYIAFLCAEIQKSCTGCSSIGFQIL